MLPHRAWGQLLRPDVFRWRRAHALLDAKENWRIAKRPRRKEDRSFWRAEKRRAPPPNWLRFRRRWRGPARFPTKPDSTTGRQGRREWHAWRRSPRGWLATCGQAGTN